MDYLRSELIPPYVIEDRLAAAARQRLIAALRAASDCGCRPRPAARLGRWLVRAGHRLEARADPCRAITWGVVLDPCRGCAD